MMKSTFFQICAGISMVICSLALLALTTQPSTAAPTPQEFIDAGTSKIGKYQMSLSTTTDANGLYFNVIVWDSETGKSKFYKRTGAEEWGESKFQLPTQPVGN
ncbi:MAG: hypothetical protein L6Q81_01635 [Bacteroidia bacterium]|nr:hypothetical protein [Bacteroidia bacterium]